MVELRGGEADARLWRRREFGFIMAKSWGHWVLGNTLPYILYFPYLNPYKMVVPHKVN
jgi:hypothetical protein